MYRGQSQVPTIDVREAGAAAANGRAPGAESGAPGAGTAQVPLLVDVRERSEFVEVRAPGAVLYSTSSFLLHFEELPKDRPVHVICRTGSRSAAVAAFLLRNGWADVHDVAGGMVAWLRAGLDVRRGPLQPGEGDVE